MKGNYWPTPYLDMGYVQLRTYDEIFEEEMVSPGLLQVMLNVPLISDETQNRFFYAGIHTNDFDKNTPLVLGLEIEFSEFEEEEGEDEEGNKVTKIIKGDLIQTELTKYAHFIYFADVPCVASGEEVLSPNVWHTFEEVELNESLEFTDAYPYRSKLAFILCYQLEVIPA